MATNKRIRDALDRAAADELFFWHGTVATWAGGSRIDGSWVRSATLPNAAEFERSRNEFHLTTSVSLSTSFNSGFEMRGGWRRVERGRTERETSRLEMDDEVTSHISGGRILGLRGRNGFGEFVGVGRLDGPRITLARRYIASTDPRVTATAQQLAELAEAEHRHRAQPWNCSCMSQDGERWRGATGVTRARAETQAGKEREEQLKRTKLASDLESDQPTARGWDWDRLEEEVATKADDDDEEEPIYLSLGFSSDVAQ